MDGKDQVIFNTIEITSWENIELSTQGRISNEIYREGENWVDRQTIRVGRSLI